MKQKYDVGRGTLREALRYLEFQGVLTIRPGPNGGPVVAGPGPRHLSRTLGLLLQFADASFSHLLEVRLVLEPKIASMAAREIDDESLEVLQDSVKHMREHLADRERFFEENARFHDVIAWSSGNPLFASLVEALHGVTDGANLGAQYPEPRRRRVADAHERIYHAIEGGTPEAAEEAMYEHVLATYKYTRKMHRELFETELNWDHFVG